MITDYSKQSELLDVSKVDVPIHVIGCGALGSWLVFFLLKMGFTNIHVYDYDTVEEHNIPNQLFMESQIGSMKVHSVHHIYEAFFRENKDQPRLIIHRQKITEDSPQMQGYIFCAVDSMKFRKELFSRMYEFNPRADFWCEGRLGLYGAYIYTLDQKRMSQFAKYMETMYDDVEAEVSTCGVSQTALPSAVNCATIMIMQMINSLQREEVDNVIEYSIPWMVSITKKWD